MGSQNKLAWKPGNAASHGKMWASCGLEDGTGQGEGWNLPIYSFCSKLAFNVNIIYRDWGWVLKQTGCWILRHFHPLCFQCINRSLPLLGSSIVATSRSSGQWLNCLWAGCPAKNKSSRVESSCAVYLAQQESSKVAGMAGAAILPAQNITEDQDCRASQLSTSILLANRRAKLVSLYATNSAQSEIADVGSKSTSPAARGHKVPQRCTSVMPAGSDLAFREKLCWQIHISSNRLIALA